MSEEKKTTRVEACVDKVQDISFKKVWATLKERMGVMVAIVAVVFGLGCGYTFLVKKPLYKTTASVVMIDSSIKTIDDLLLGKGLAVSYAEILKSQVLAEAVIDRLGLSVSATELPEQVAIASSANTGLVSVTVTDRNAEQAAKIANEMMTVFKERIKEEYDYTAMTTVSVADVPEEPYNVSYLKDLVVCFVAGVVLALGVVFLFFYKG